MLVCTAHFKEELLFQLLEWSPTVIVLEPALDRLIKLGIKLDLVLCQDQCLQKLKEEVAHQLPVKLIPLVGTQDLLSKATDILGQMNYGALNILGCSDLYPFLETSPTKLDPIVWIEQVKWSYCRSGRFYKWLTKDTKLAFIEQDQVAIAPEEGVLLKMEKPYKTYITSQDGMVKVTANDTGFWLGEFH